MKLNSSRFLFILLALASLLGASLACSAGSGSEAETETPSESVPAAEDSGEEAEPAAGGVTFESFKLFRDDGSGEPGEEVSSFNTSDHIQHFLVDASDFLEPGSEVKWVFTAVDTSAGEDIYITEVKTAVQMANQLTAQLELDEDFPAGSYRADIYINDELVESYAYTVEE